MSQYLWATGDLITAERLNSNSYKLFSGVAGYEAPVTLADNVAGTLLLKPNVDPATTTRLFQVQNAAGTVQFYITADGTFRSTGSPTMLKLDEQVLAAPAGSVTLTTSAEPLSHLQIIGYAALDTAANFALRYLGVQFNADATAGRYDAGFTLAKPSAVTVISALAEAQMRLGYVPATADLANGFAAYTFTIPYYRNTANKKVITGQWGYKSGFASETLGIWQGQGSGTWNQTDAITSITLFEASGTDNFVAGTVWTLLGLP